MFSTTALGYVNGRIGAIVIIIVYSLCVIWVWQGHTLTLTIGVAVSPQSLACTVPTAGRHCSRSDVVGTLTFIFLQLNREVSKDVRQKLATSLRQFSNYKPQ